MTNKITANVSGIHCASCAKIIEQTLKKNPEIEAVVVNPLTEQAEISYQSPALDIEKIKKQTAKIGYTLSFQKIKNSQAETSEPPSRLASFKEKKMAELQEQRRKIKVALPLAILVLIIAFWGLAANYLNFQPVELLPGKIFVPAVFLISSFILFWMGGDYLRATGRFFVSGQANMDTLIGLGTGTAYFYSAVIFLFPQLLTIFNLEAMYFFDITIVVITLVYLGKYLENKAKLKTNEVIEKLINLQSKTALIEEAGQEKEVPLAELKVNDIVLVKPGLKIPADGQIVFGWSTVDEALLTGESLPIDKTVGDKVIGATLNKQGFLKIKVSQVDSETVLASIIAAIEKAQNSKAPIQKLADRVSGVFVPIVLGLAILTLIAWLVIAPKYIPWPQAVSLGITCFISILAIACPCALGLATPTGIMVGLGLASKNGLLIKNASSLEKFGQVKTIIFDKTGTITSGQPRVTEIISQTLARAAILKIAASLENKSLHPIALAITDLARQEKLTFEEIDNFSDYPGQGVCGEIAGQKYWLGNAKLIASLKLTAPLQEINKLSQQGKTSVILSDGQAVLGYLAVADTIKTGTKAALSALNKLGIKTIMLSGDHQTTAEYIGAQVGISEIMAEVSPLEKAGRVREIRQRDGLTAMVGDGINDAVALIEADIGIAMADGSDVAIESADITVLHGDLAKIVTALKISRLTMRKIKQNLFWAFFYNIIAIPLAAGALYPFFGWLLSPIIAAGAMTFSSISVLLNTLLMKRIKFTTSALA